MRSDIATVGFLLLFLLVFIFCSNSCSEPSSQDPLEFTQNNFDAELCGAIDGNEFSAFLQCCSASDRNGKSISVEFSSPLSVRGMKISKGANGEYKLELGDMITNKVNASGLMEPFSALFENKKATSSRKGDHGERILSVCDENCDLEYIFLLDDTYPCKIRGTINERKIDINIKIFEDLNQD